MATLLPAATKRSSLTAKACTIADRESAVKTLPLMNTVSAGRTSRPAATPREPSSRQAKAPAPAPNIANGRRMCISGFSASMSLVEHRDAVDLDIDAGAVRHTAGTRPRDLLAGHSSWKLQVYVIHLLGANMMRLIALAVAAYCILAPGFARAADAAEQMVGSWK